jgi:predicted nucleotidyltransferase
MENTKMIESVIDKPHETLDTIIWNINNNPPTLTDVAQKKINTIIEWVTSKYNIPNLSVFIIGSITSNQYTKTSDIDIDFSSDFMNDKSEDEIKDFGWKMKSDFMENFPEE